MACENTYVFLRFLTFFFKIQKKRDFLRFLSGWPRFLEHWWRSYGQKCDFQYGGRRHLGFCRIQVPRVKFVQGPYSLCLYQIWCKSVQKWWSYGRLTDFKMAAAAIFLHYVNFHGRSKSVCGTPFSTYVSNSVQMHAIMAELWSKMWFSIRHLELLFRNPGPPTKSTSRPEHCVKI